MPFYIVLNSNTTENYYLLYYPKITAIFCTIPIHSILNILYQQCQNHNLCVQKMCPWSNHNFLFHLHVAALVGRCGLHKTLGSHVCSPAAQKPMQLENWTVAMPRMPWWLVLPRRAAGQRRNSHSTERSNQTPDPDQGLSSTVLDQICIWLSLQLVF